MVAVAQEVQAVEEMVVIILLMFQEALVLLVKLILAEVQAVDLLIWEIVEMVAQEL